MSTRKMEEMKGGLSCAADGCKADADIFFVDYWGRRFGHCKKHEAISHKTFAEFKRTGMLREVSKEEYVVREVMES